MLQHNPGARGGSAYRRLRFADLSLSLQFAVQRVLTSSTDGREEEACVDPKAHKHTHMLTQQTAIGSNPRASWSGRGPSPCFKLSFPPDDRFECSLWKWRCIPAGLPVRRFWGGCTDHCSISPLPKEGEGARGSGMLCAIIANDMLSCELWP